jgi:predicted  nucleic acid-binding Zn-ribbon protein
VGSSPGSLIRLFDARLVSTDDLNLLSPVLQPLQAFLEKARALLEELRADLDEILPRLSKLRDDLEESSACIKKSSERRFRRQSDRSGSAAVTERPLHRLERQRPVIEG